MLCWRTPAGAGRRPTSASRSVAANGKWPAGPRPRSTRGTGDLAPLTSFWLVAILVDAAVWPWRGRRWAHLVSDDSYDELHGFARQLGIPRRAFQGDHYD